MVQKNKETWGSYERQNQEANDLSNINLLGFPFGFYVRKCSFSLGKSLI